MASPALRRRGAALLPGPARPPPSASSCAAACGPRPRPQPRAPPRRAASAPAHGPLRSRACTAARGPRPPLPPLLRGVERLHANIRLPANGPPPRAKPPGGRAAGGARGPRTSCASGSAVAGLRSRRAPVPSPRPSRSPPLGGTKRCRGLCESSPSLGRCLVAARTHRPSPAGRGGSPASARRSPAPRRREATGHDTALGPQLEPGFNFAASFPGMEFFFF